MTAPAPAWRPFVDAEHPKTARYYRNTTTGEVLNRREYDKRVGRFAGTDLSPEKLQSERRTNPDFTSELVQGKTTRGTIQSGFTDYYHAPHTVDQMSALLIHLRREGYTLIRFIYARPGLPNITSGWERLTLINLPNILNEYMYQPQRYPPNDPEAPAYQPSDMTYVAAVKQLSRRAA